MRDMGREGLPEESQFGMKRTDMIYLQDGSGVPYLDFEFELEDQYKGNPPVFLPLRRNAYATGDNMEFQTNEGIPIELTDLLEMLGVDKDQIPPEFSEYYRIGKRSDASVLCFRRRLYLGSDDLFDGTLEKMQEAMKPVAMCWAGSGSGKYTVGYGAGHFVDWLNSVPEEQRTYFTIGAERGGSLLNIGGKKHNRVSVTYSYAVSLHPDDEDLAGLLPADKIGRAVLEPSWFEIPMNDLTGMDTYPMEYIGGVFGGLAIDQDEPIISFFTVSPNSMVDLALPKLYRKGERVIPITGVNAATHFINQGSFLRIKKLEKYNDIMWVYGHDVPNLPLNPRGQASLF